MATKESNNNPPEENSKEISWNLPSGKNATLVPGKAKHAVAASRISDGDQSKYLPALIAQLVRIEGVRVKMEDVVEFDLKDYNSIMIKMSDENFI